MELWIPAITIVGIYALAVISPGPNFLVITRNALSYSRTIGLQTALGVASGSILWIAFGFLGVAAIFSQAPWLFAILKTLGGAYLLYIAARIARAHLGNGPSAGLIAEAAAPTEAQIRAYRHGLLTQLSNPKAALFVLALFSSAIPASTPVSMKLGMALAMTLTSFSWYLLVAIFFSRPAAQRTYRRLQRPANLAFAALLAWLAVNLLLST